MEKIFDVSAVCNALMDIIVDATDKDLAHFGLTKGIMHLVDHSRQVEILNYLSSYQQTVELGGSSMNAIRALSALGKSTVFAGAISDDAYGHAIKNRMGELKIEHRLGVVSGGTGTCVILVTPDGERTMNTCLGASRLYGESLIPHEDIARSKVFHFCGYQWDTAAQKQGILDALATAKKHGTLISFDLADPFVVKHNRDDFIKIIQEFADIVFCNEEESRLLFESSPEDAAHRIKQMDAIGIVKLGARGALIAQGSTILKALPVPTTVVDTTAAGDMFAGGFLYGYTSGKDLATCGKIAATLASDVISRYGARLSDQALAMTKEI
jgi:sugar/nucleoside kinase (ribokinase family)